MLGSDRRASPMVKAVTIVIIVVRTSKTKCLHRLFTAVSSMGDGDNNRLVCREFCPLNDSPAAHHQFEPHFDVKNIGFTKIKVPSKVEPD